MTKRVIQTSPDIGLTIRLPRRQTVVQQAAPQTVAAAPGAPVWLGWQAQGGAACARLIYPACTPQLGSGGSGWDQEWGTGEAQALETPTLPPWPYPQAWLAGVPPVEKPDDWRICQRITWTARATLKIRTLDLDILRAGEIPHELIEREAQTVWEREIELDVPAAPPAAEPPQGGRSPLGGQRVTAAQSAAGANVGVVHSPEPAAAVPEPASEAQPASAPSENPVLRALENQDWRTVETLLALTGQRAQLAGRCEWLRWQAPELHLRLHPDDRHLSEGTLPRELEELLAEHLGQPVRLRIELAAPQGETPHQRRRAEKSARLDAARQTLLDAPLVGQLMNDYGAALDERSLEVLARAKPSTSPTPEEPTP